MAFKNEQMSFPRNERSLFVPDTNTRILHTRNLFKYLFLNRSQWCYRLVCLLVGYFSPIAKQLGIEFIEKASHGFFVFN